MDTRSLLSGIAIGAAATLIFDPDRGARRRALMRDKAVRAGRVTGEILDTTVRDLANRTRGLASETKGWITDRSVINQLEPHDSADGVPDLQGAGHVAGPRLDILQANWAPATRALVGAAAVAAGGIALAYSRR